MEAVGIRKRTDPDKKTCPECYYYNAGQDCARKGKAKHLGRCWLIARDVDEDSKDACEDFVPKDEL